MSTPLKNSEQPKRPHPVLMIPLRRCGSNAIRLRLGSNPDFYSPPPLNIVDFMPLLELYGDLSDDRSYFQLINDVIGLQNATIAKWRGVALDPITVFEALADRPRSVHAVTWELLLQAGEIHGARVVMDKSNDSVKYAEQHLEVQPELRFLNVVRDPRAQVSSMNKAIVYDFDTMLNTLTWIRAREASDAVINRHPDRVLTIRYEDLLLESEPTLQRMCEFLEISYSPDMLDTGKSAEARSLAGRSALWANNAKPLDPSFIAKYVNNLSQEEVGVIETLTADYMARYGYTPARQSSGTVTVSDAMIEEAKQRSQERRESAWEQLHERDSQDYQLRKFRSWYIGAVRERLLATP